MDFLLNGQTIQLQKVKKTSTGVSFELDGKNYAFELRGELNGQVVLGEVQGEVLAQRRFSLFQLNDSTYQLESEGRAHLIEVSRAHGKRSSGGSGQVAGPNILSPMPGKVFKILVKPGEVVKAGTSVIILEAMKMEHTIKATMDGKIQEILCKLGGQVAPGDLLLKILP